MGSYIPQVAQFFSRLITQPSTAIAALYNNLITSLVNSGVWAKLDALYLPAAADEATADTNLVSANYTLVPDSGMGFVPNLGYYRVGTIGIDTGFNPTTAVGANFSLNSSSEFTFNPVAGYSTSMGNANDLILANNLGTDVVRAGNTTNVAVPDTWGGVGLTTVVRSSSTTGAIYHNAADVGTISNSSVALSNGDLQIINDGLGQYSSGIASAAGFGGALTQSDVSALWSAIETYLTGVNAIQQPFAGGSSAIQEVNYFPDNARAGVNVGNVLQFGISQPWTMITYVNLYTVAMQSFSGTRAIMLMGNAVSRHSPATSSGSTVGLAMERSLAFCGLNSSAAFPIIIWVSMAASLYPLMASIISWWKLTMGPAHPPESNFISMAYLTRIFRLKSNDLTGSIVTSNPMLIGEQTGAAFWLPGSMGGMYMSNIVRDASYIDSYVTSPPPVDANTILAYSFSEGSGTTTADASSNHYTGTLASAGMWVPTTWQPGPSVTSVAANPANADLNAGNTVLLTIGFSGNVTVTGSPYLSLNDGGRATYTAGSGTASLTFTYLVASGQNIADLTVTGLSLNGGTIRDGTAKDAILTAAATNPAGTLQIDTKPPAVTEQLTTDTGVSASDKITNNDTLKGGGDPNAVVQFIVDGNPIAATTTASSTGAWTFMPTGLADGQHTVVASETDAAGNTGTASLTFTLDTTAPIATGIVAMTSSGDLNVGHTVGLTVTFDGPVYVTGTPYLITRTTMARLITRAVPAPISSASPIRSRPVRIPPIWASPAAVQGYATSRATHRTSPTSSVTCRDRCRSIPSLQR